MTDCINSLYQQDDSVYDDFKKALSSGTLFVEVTKGSLKGTFGKFYFLEVDHTHYNARRYWHAFLQKPSKDLYNRFIKSITKESKNPKISMLCADKGRDIVVAASAANCSWSFIAKPCVKVSAPRKVVVKPPEPIPDVYDHLGEKINIGDFCSYILYHHRCSGAQIYYGTVTRITPKGDVYCTDVNVGDWPDGSSTPMEKKVLDPSMITVMNETIMDRIILARLAS